MSVAESAPPPRARERAARGVRMRVLRAARDWSQSDLGAKVGVSRQTINAIEAERADPRPSWR